MNDVYQLNDVRFFYRRKQVIEVGQLTIPSHASTVVLGDNGAGKTTLLSLLGFVLTPDAGEIFFKGQRVTKQNNLSLRRRIATLQQRPYLFKGTVLDNAALALKLRGTANLIAKDQAMQGLEQVGLTSLAQRSANTLSGGEAQRVALARCLVLQPEVLLLDEPFSHLDRTSAKLIHNAMRDFISNNGTVIFTTHDDSLWPDLADHVVLLKHGRIVDNSEIRQQIV
jgi:ABC-type multidrug transport system ATPase subunit